MEIHLYFLARKLLWSTNTIETLGYLLFQLFGSIAWGIPFSVLIKKHSGADKIYNWNKTPIKSFPIPI